MASSLEHVDACLPVTSLKALALGDTRLLFVGQGPFVRLVDEDTGAVLAYFRAFRSNNIHGFAVLHQKEQDSGEINVRLLAWGDRSLRIIELSCLRNQTAKSVMSLVVASAEYLAPDWILTGCAPSTRSEGSTAYLVTAHNVVLGLTVVEDSSSNFGRAIRLRQLVVGVKSILYSANIISIAPSRLLVAAGTVFGEIIVWSCFILDKEGFAAETTSSIHHFFTGHEGSIFDVQISPRIDKLHGNLAGRLLASCSDDRTIRVWDISDCEQVSSGEPSAYATDGFELRCTGFGHVKEDTELGSESCVASAFGHGARIWGVDFFAAQLSQGKIGLVSRGEDAHCLVWDLSWEPTSSRKSDFKLNNLCSLRPHSGKHIWSLGMSDIGAATTFYTGGADGAVRTFKLIQENGELVCPNRTIRIVVTAGSERTEGAAKVLMRGFAFVSPDCFLATTRLGEVQVGWIESPNSSNRRIARETLFFEEDLRFYTTIAGLPSRGIALFGNQQGIIRFYEHASRSITKVADVGQRPVGLYALDYHSETLESPAIVTFLTTYVDRDTADLFHIHLPRNSDPHLERVALHVPQGFDISCASLIKNNEYLVLGSRLGSLVVYRVRGTGSLQPLLKVVRVHSKDGVNQILPLSHLSSAVSTESTYFLTCGRDGNYRVNSLEVSNDSEEAVSLRTVHSPTALGFKAEGAYLDTSCHQLMLYGFSGMEFVIWNESTQSEIARIHCGGAHRRWAFQPSSERPGDGLLLWAQGGFNAAHISAHTIRTICAGGHGREIKALGTLQATEGQPPLFVTGSEDTTLRVFTPTKVSGKGSWSTLECLRVLTAHDSGPQHIGWSSDGKFLFTSSAMEDFYVWKVGSLPLFGLTAALLGCCPKSNPKSELRVTCFDILEVESDGSEASFLLCLTYSNSTMTVFHLSCTNENGRFTLLANGTYTSNCLTQVKFLRSQTMLCLVTTSTDGHFTLWDLTTVLEPFYNIAPTLRLKNPLEGLSITPENIACEYRHQVHSNSIKSMDLVQLSDITTLVIAGGDDNAVTLSLLYTDLKGTETTGRAATIVIPDAHAASVNAVRVIERSITRSEPGMRLSFVSSGNDHRVKIWQVEIDMSDRPTLDGLQVQNTLDRHSPVADISSLDVICDEGETKLLVCGVGMEYFKVNLQ
ncbi:tRNA (34-2'-O)-methyltransferase regulator RTT10 [Aspergillus lucknowensis]|uniref:WD repeat protein n=1 Tax=Aspergillus lucknowensis TaxID=176173 RepID=A0ABR4LHA3_9EURO